jgi:hypothetical protein
MRITYIATILLIMIILACFGVVLASEAIEESHCTFGALGLFLIIITFSTGFLLSGRIGNVKPFRIHKYGTILISLYFTGEFGYGLMNKNWDFVITIHSIFGLLIPIFAWFVIVFSPCFLGKKMNRKISSKIHITFAFILIMLVLIQVLYGYLFFE